MNTGLPVQMFQAPKKPRDTSRFTAVLVRMPKELHEELKRFSRAGYRTLTGEIVLRLQESLEGQSIDEHGVIVVRSAQSLK